MSSTPIPMSLEHLRALLHSDTDLVDDWESALFEVARKARRCCCPAPAPASHADPRQ